MFVMTLNKSGLKKLAAVGVCALALAAGAVGLNLLEDDAAAAAAAPASVAGQQITGAEDLRTFLAGYGLEVDPTAAQVSTVKVPRKWDDSFEAFHAVVEQSGLSLKKCRGKEVDKWMVPLPGQSTDTAQVYAVVLVYKNEARGAYLLEEPSGEVRSLTPTQAAASPAQDTVLAAAQSAAQAAAQTAEEAAAGAPASSAAPAASSQPAGTAADAGAPAEVTAAEAGAVPVE